MDIQIGLEGHLSALRQRPDVQVLAQADRLLRDVRAGLSFRSAGRRTGVLLALRGGAAADLLRGLAGSGAQPAGLGAPADVVSADDRRLRPAAAADQGLAGRLAIREQEPGSRHPGPVGQAPRRRGAAAEGLAAYLYMPSRRLMPCSSQAFIAQSICDQPWQLP